MPDTLATLPASTRISRYAAIFGPGLVVMLADTDVGSIITAAQSGAQWGYRLLLLQVVLMPILFMVQEMTVRLGLHTGRGHGELIADTFGRAWAWVSVAGLAVAVFGALITELSGVAGIGELYGVPRGLSLGLATVALLAVVLTGSYRRVERIAIALGLFELAFFVVAWMAQPGLAEMAQGAVTIPYANKEYVYLAAANIGAVIMPWMVFYQQSAIADKGLDPSHLRAARWDTAIGAVITQLVMAAVLVATATGWMMVPARPGVLRHMVSPARYRDPQYVRAIAGKIYGGTIRHSPELAKALLVEGDRPPSQRAYLFQLLAAAGWTSTPFLPLIRQQTLVLHGSDDPLVPLVNARLLTRLLPHARLHVYDDGHLALVTHAAELAPVVSEKSYGLLEERQ